MAYKDNVIKDNGFHITISTGVLKFYFFGNKYIVLLYNIIIVYISVHLLIN